MPNFLQKYLGHSTLQITFVGQFSDFFQLRFYFLESSVEGTVQQLANNVCLSGSAVLFISVVSLSSRFVSKFCWSSFSSFVSSLLTISCSSFVSIFLRELSQISVSFDDVVVTTPGGAILLIRPISFSSQFFEFQQYRRDVLGLFLGGNLIKVGGGIN